MREALKAQCLSIDAHATVNNPMAAVQLASDDLGDLQRQAAEFTPNKDKAVASARTFSACACCACTA